MEHAIQSLKRETSDKQTQACKRIDELQQKITTLQHTLEETTSRHRMKIMVCVINIYYNLQHLVRSNPLHYYVVKSLNDIHPSLNHCHWFSRYLYYLVDWISIIPNILLKQRNIPAHNHSALRPVCSPFSVSIMSKFGAP